MLNILALLDYMYEYWDHRLGVRNNCSSGLSDDEPLYDSVASDDDYYTIQVRKGTILPTTKKLRLLVQDRGEEARSSLGANGRGVSEALDGASGVSGY